MLVKLDGRFVRREGSMIDELTTVNVEEASALMRRMKQHLRPQCTTL